MKHAAAMKYGGELVAAEDCTYDSFKELVPLCPNCKEPVFLRIGGDRLSVKGNEYKVGPHWCHFKGISAEQVAGCEARVSGYTESDRQRIAAKARGQRLKLLQRWFWKIVKDWARFDSVIHNGESESMEMEDIESLSSSFKILIDQDHYLHSTVDTLRLYLDELVRDISQMNKLVEGFVTSLIKNAPNDDNLSYRSAIGSRLDLIQKHEKLLHCNIVREVTCFLLTKQNRLSLLNDLLGLVVLAYLSGDTDEGSIDDKLKALDVNELAWGFFSVIAVTPWASEFQRLESESKAKVTPTP